LLTAFAFVALIVAILVIIPPATHVGAVEKATDVRVVNLSSEPVPTTAQGTTNIAGNVNVANTPNVNVANTPNVNLAAGAQVGINPSANTVRLTNTLTSPLPVRDVDFGRQPFQDSASDTQQPGTNASTITIATVPAGKRLVIEFLSALAQMPAGQSLVGCQINTIAPPFGGVTHELLINEQPAFVNGDALWRASQHLRLYADPGSSVRMLVTRDSSAGQALFLATVSGYLVDVP
jgi:hypothetical protein